MSQGADFLGSQISRGDLKCTPQAGGSAMHPARFKAFEDRVKSMTADELRELSSMIRDRLQDLHDELQAVSLHLATERQRQPEYASYSFWSDLHT
jgi:hypothetical protein